MTKNLQIFPLLSHKYEGVNFKSLSNTAAVMISCCCYRKILPIKNRSYFLWLEQKLDMQEKCWYISSVKISKPKKYVQGVPTLVCMF